MDTDRAAFAHFDFSRKERRTRLESLVAAVCDKLVLLIVKTGTSLGDWKYASLRIAKGNGFSVYRIQASDASKGVDLVLRMPWYKPTFHFLFGDNELADRLGDAVRKEKGQTIDSIESALAPLIIGYMEPVDDVLECYGTQEFEELIKSIGGP